VIGWRADAALLASTGATVTTVGGCCGLAGNFGVEQGHYDVSVAVAEHDLLPAVRQRPDAVVLADGFSCRTQLAELADRHAVTLAELLSPRFQAPTTHTAVLPQPTSDPHDGSATATPPDAQQRATLDQRSVDVP
jgi:hypothetical protein